jgi:galactitol-specific phosphotransferase system IIB component
MNKYNINGLISQRGLANCIEEIIMIQMDRKEDPIGEVWLKNWVGVGVPIGIGKLREEIHGANYYPGAVETLKDQLEADRLEVIVRVKVFPGQKKVLLIDADAAIEANFGVDLDKPNIFADIYVDEEGLSQRKIKTRVITSREQKFDEPDFVFISQKLAKDIGVDEGGEIVISRIYQKKKKINLDDLLKTSQNKSTNET